MACVNRGALPEGTPVAITVVTDRRTLTEIVVR